MGNKGSRPSTSTITRSTPPAQQHASPSYAFQRCINVDMAATIRRNLPSELRLPPQPNNFLPIVYSDEYNISFFGIEKLHPFDSQKYKRVLSMLESSGVLKKEQLTPAPEATLELLRDVHSAEYLNALEHSPLKVAMVTELLPLSLLPSFLLRKKVLRPMRQMAGGTVVAGALALVERGWALNLGGGMHHAHYHDGGGWCCYDDIMLMLRSLCRASDGKFNKAMVVDLDVHQGNGTARSKLHFAKERKKNEFESSSSSSLPLEIFIVDVYNGEVYPQDSKAKAGIDVDVPLRSGTADAEYLAAVHAALDTAFHRCKPPPQLLVFNAGTDILEGDPLGRLAVSEQGVVQRDELVFETALRHGVPVVMLTSGGYSKASAGCIAKSVENLVKKYGDGSVGVG